MSKFLARWVGALFAAVLWASSGGAALAALPVGVGIQFTICNLGDTETLPNAGGAFICANYSGNAGKNWSELDLVPLRIELRAGTSAPPTQTYTLALVVDREDVGRPGYDVLSAPVLNTSLSHASCVAPTTVGAQTTLTPGIGGTDISLYRLVSFTQAEKTLCVYDYYARLALGSHLFPGGSLHANLLNESFETGGVGAQDRSILVKEIAPQEMKKDMTASRDAAHAWNITKNATPGSLDFDDVCKAPAGPLEKSLEVTVTWTKVAASPTGDVTVFTNINVKNPAARTITIDVTDSIYAGATKAGAALATQSTPVGGIDVAANFNGLLTTFTYTLPAASAGSIGSYLNDEAVATYTDKVTGVLVPGNITAVASAQIQQGTLLNETANIADLETITGNGLGFKVAAPSTGAFGGYTAGDLATAVNWGVTGLSGDGSIKFAKTVVLDQRRITSGKLEDVATLVSTDSAYTTNASLFPVDIQSSATVSLKVSKTLPLALKAGESVVVNFSVTPTAGGTPIPMTVTFTGPTAIGASAESAAVTNLAPASYTVTEGTSTFFDAANPGGLALNLVPDTPSKTLDLSPKAGGVMDSSNCSGSVSFVNSIAGGDYPKAQVAKITNPVQAAGDDGWEWTFTLSGPAGFVGTDATANAGVAAVAFGVSLTEEGTYTVTETSKPKWDLTSVIQPDGSSSTSSCTFTVDFPTDFGKTFGCTFTNTKRGYVKVVKTLNGLALTTEQFTFQLRQGATGSAEGTALETLMTNVAPSGSTLNFTTALLPTTASQTNTYQMCESVGAGWLTAFTDPNDPLFVPGAFQPPTGVIPNPNVDNSWLCVNFTVAPGQTRTIAVDNAPPPGGRALTIGYWKTHASCTSSSTKKEAALDKTLYGYLPNGILKSSKIVSVVNGSFGLYGQNATSTADCAHAVSLLDKRDFNGAKKASDPLFNMAAQLVAAELNLAAGAKTCGAVVVAVNTAEGLLAMKAFTGFGYANPKLTAAQATLANTTATTLDDYNNNRTSVCP